MAAGTKKNQTQLVLPEPRSSSSSCSFIKKLTGCAISTIVYSRNLFDESDFSNKQFEGINIKVIKGNSQSSNAARCLSNWLEGAFHAMDQKYLKSLIFEIKDDKECLLETYLFNFSYEDGQTKCTVERREEENETEPTEVSGAPRQAVRNLLRNILVMTSVMPDLPLKCTTCVKIVYYDEVTPEDYEPPGFKAFFGSSSEFIGATQKWNCGVVKTPFHSLTVRTRQLAQVNPLSSSADDGDPSKTVQCLCEKMDCIGSMLKCDECGSLQHAACYKIFIEDDVSQRTHKCLKCEGNIPDKDYDSTECVFRRVLATCIKLKSISVSKLKQALNLDASSTLLYLRRLQKEGALSKSTQPFTMEKPDFLYNVNKSNIMLTLRSKYFN